MSRSGESQDYARGEDGGFYVDPETIINPVRSNKSGRRMFALASVLGISVVGLVGSASLLANIGSNANVFKVERIQLQESEPMVLRLSPHDFGQEEWDAEFFRFYNEYNKRREYTFASHAYRSRQDKFKTNTLMIFDHNLGKDARDSEEHNIKLKENQFSDLSWQDFQDLHLNAREGTQEYSIPRVKGDQVHRILGDIKRLPKQVDWHAKGCVTDVKDQMKCGSCWAFSSTGAIEGAVCAATGRLVSLSEQQLLDCSGAEGTHGCNGGFMDPAFNFVLRNRGICSEEEYPYAGVETDCRNDCRPVATITGLLDLPPHNETIVMAALAKFGPVAVGIEADKPAFQFYHEGVFRLKCGRHLNHAVLVTGYGTDSESGEHYWLIKNSWGGSWGDSGYIKLSRDIRRTNGECGLLLAPTVPLVRHESLDDLVLDR